MNNPNKIPALYARVMEIILSDREDLPNIIRTDDGGEILFFLSPGDRVLKAKTASQRVARRWIEANYEISDKIQEGEPEGQVLHKQPHKKEDPYDGSLVPPVRDSYGDQMQTPKFPGNLNELAKKL